MQGQAQWARIVDAIVRGDHLRRPTIVIGSTPKPLRLLGLAPADLVMATGKIGRCRREHSEVPLGTWHSLPTLLRDTLAAFPSARLDGSIVVVLVVSDRNGDPILVPIAPGAGGEPNVVLSIYGKEAGLPWVYAQVARAVANGLPYYVRNDFAASMPQPGSAEAIPSSPGPIPANGTAKSGKNILTIRKNSIKN